jgi:hypothetical protein
MSCEQLSCILENVRYQISIKRNNYLFDSVLETGLISFEKMSGYIGFDCSGAYSELQKDDSFKNDLLIIK